MGFLTRDQASCPVSTVVVAGLLAAHLLLASAASALAGQDEENPFTESADVRIGERMFLRYCGRCHGDNAKGGIGPDLTTGRFRHGATTSRSSE